VAGQRVDAQPYGQLLRRLETNHGQVIVRLSEIPGAQTNDQGQGQKDKNKIP
jgi:hypothetical protein